MYVSWFGADTDFAQYTSQLESDAKRQAEAAAEEQPKTKRAKTEEADAEGGEDDDLDMEDVI
jgi:hypothetical protein